MAKEPFFTVAKRNVIRFIKDCFTIKDGESWDLGRIMWFLGAMIFNALSIWSIAQGQIFDPIAWGTGFGAVLAAGGMALMLKENSEPQPEKPVEGQ
jgi:hypothetical protein